MQIFLFLLSFLCAYQIWKNSSITEEKKRGFFLFVMAFFTGLLFWGVVLVVSIGTVAELFDWDRRWIPRMILVTIICTLIMAAVKVVETANFLEKLASGEVMARIGKETKRGKDSFSQLNKQRKILLIGAMMIVVVLLFPPTERGGFSFIFLTRLRYIDTAFLLVELLAIISLVAIAFLYTRASDTEDWVTLAQDETPIRTAQNILNARKTTTDSCWIEELIAWADENNIPGTQFPRDREKIVNLTELNLGGNNLSEIPASIGMLKNLTTLDLGQNNLSELPASIGQLKNLTDLYLDRNNFSVLPAFIGQLESLTRLYLGHNPIKKLPPELAHLDDIVNGVCK